MRRPIASTTVVLAWWFVLALLVSLACREARAQQARPWRPSTGPGRAEPDQSVQPDQPVQLRQPTLHRRPAAGPARPQHATPPAQTEMPEHFPLSPQQQQQVDWALQRWEQLSSKTKKFRCEFTRYEYDPEAPRAQGADPNSPVHTDRGEIRYSAPDRGLFAVERPESRRERWVCDGESVFEYRYETKTLVEYPLPEELQGKAIANGPLPFIFQAEADKLRRRYWLRLTTPPNVQGEIWLEAYPKHQQDRANFRRAEIILDARRMQPQAMQIVLPTGTMKHSYVFEDIKVNDPFGFLHGNPFSATTPIGWRKEVERPEPAQVGGRQQSPRR